MAQVQGYQVRPNGLMGYVKCGKVQRTKLFPHGTDPDEITAWRAQTRVDLKKTRPSKGTLAADIEAFLADMPEGRRKVDFSGWLQRWAQSPFGAKPRNAMTREDLVKQFRTWAREGYAGSSINHLRQVLLSLWKHLDGPEGFSACPARFIPKAKEAHPKQGFFEQEQIDAVLSHLSDDYRDVVEFAAFSGWRKGEIQGLTWNEVDYVGGVIRLSPERSKTAQGRVLPIVGPIKAVIDRRIAKRDAYGLPFVFGYQYGGKRTKVRYRGIGDWRKAWATACAAAKVQNRTLHDFRRTVVRNLTRAGIPERVAMSWTGHKTRSVFDRYNIVREDDLFHAGQKLSAFIEKVA